MRYLRVAVPRAVAEDRPPRISLPLVVLCVVANPTGVRPLAVEAEWRRLNDALAPLIHDGSLRLERMPRVTIGGSRATLAGLQDRLLDPQQGPVHGLHFMGHGYFDAGEGGLVFEGADGSAHFVSASMVAATLCDHAALRLVFLNVCRGAAGGVGSLFGGVGPRLVQGGVPMVVAMQHAIGDRAAIDLAARFYRSLAEGRPVDGALATARAALPGGASQSGAPRFGAPQWAAVLFSRLEDNRLLDPAPADPEAQALADALALFERMPLRAVPPVAPSLPAGSRMVLRPNPLFVGRAEELLALVEGLGAPTPAGAPMGVATMAVGQVAAATGAGGIGKTQLAVEFVHRYGPFFAGGVFWLSFADPGGVKNEIALCGGPGAMNLPGLTDLKLDDQVGRVLAEWGKPVPRLLVFDNCEEEELLAQWRPVTGGCRVLVTSRREAWDPALGIVARRLDVLPRAESVALLRGFRPDLPPDEPGLEAIAKELADFPLALQLAGGYLARYRDDVTPAAYLAELQRLSVAGGLFDHPSLTKGGVSPTKHEQHVAHTFELSLARLDPGDPTAALARTILTRLACFAPGEPVPRHLLALTLESAPASDGGDDMATKRALADALRRLAEVGLVERTEGGAAPHAPAARPLRARRAAGRRRARGGGESAVSGSKATQRGGVPDGSCGLASATAARDGPGRACERMCRRRDSATSWATTCRR